MKRFDDGGQRMTDCCAAFATYGPNVTLANIDTVPLKCAKCGRLTTVGEGDGTEYRTEGQMTILNDKTEAFMEEFNKLTASHPFTPYLSVLDNYAVFEIQPLGGQILLGFIQTIDKGRGDGSKALRWFLDLADKHGVEVTGGIRRLGKDGLTVTELRRWYKRHGFKVDRYLSITRPPSPR